MKRYLALKLAAVALWITVCYNLIRYLIETGFMPGLTTGQMGTVFVSFLIVYPGWYYLADPLVERLGDRILTRKNET